MRNRNASLFFAFVLWMGCPLSPAAQTYYADPLAGSMKNNGSAAAPWGSLQEIIKSGRLKKLQPGDTLLLRSGDHGEARFSGNNKDFITIAAQPGQAPQLSRLEIRAGRKWIVRGLTISPAFARKPYKGMIVALGERGESRELVIEDCFVYTALDSSKWTFKDWMTANNGVLLGRHGTRLTARNNYILNTRFGLNLAAPDSLAEANVIVNFSGDGMRMMRDGQTAQYNVIKNVFVSGKDGDPNHDDAIQCFLFNKGTGTLRKLTVRGNILINREDDKQPFPNTLQAVGFFDGPLIDFLVEKNVILTSHWHGISLYDAQNCTIQDNAVYTKWTQVRLRPWIMLGQKQHLAKGNTVKNNLAHSFNFKADPEVVAENNRKVTKEEFYKRFHELEAFIDKKFGRYHPVSRYARVGMERVEKVPPRKADGKKGSAGPAKKSVSKRPMVKRPPPIPDAALASWRKRLVARVKAATRAGKHPRVYLKLFGKKPEKLTLAGGTDAELTLLVQGNKMPWAWNKLDRAGRFQLMRAVADPSRAGDLAAVAVWAGAAGQGERAETYLAKASLAMRGKKDPWVAEARALLDALAPAPAPAPQKRMGKPAHATAPPPSAKIKAKSVTQYGITWYFDREYPVGQFVNGDWWVVEPVKIISVSPAWDGKRNGSILDMGSARGQGFYNGGRWKYDASLRATFPLAVSGSSVHSLISTIGKPKPAPGGAEQFLSTAAILTIMPKAPLADAFRPAYMGKKHIYRWNDAQLNLLPNLRVPSGATLPSTSKMARPWLHNVPNVGLDLPGLGAVIHPDQNMPPYPRDSARVIGDYAVAVLLKSSNRYTYAKQLIQLGIDLYGVHTAANQRAFVASGGFGNGWKFPILFAGLMLKEQKLLKPRNMVTDLWGGVVYSFGEDGQTYYGKSGRPLFGGDGLAMGYKLPFWPNAAFRDPAGIAEVMPPSGYPGASWGGGYRMVCSSSWAGEALSARILGLQAAWGHDAWFDYVDRWVSDGYTYNGVVHLYGTDFVEKVWKTYRAKFGSVYIGLDKKTHKRRYTKNLSKIKGNSRSRKSKSKKTSGSKRARRY